MRFSLLFVLLYLTTLLSAQDKQQLSLFDTIYGAKKVEFTLTYPFDSLYTSNSDEIDAMISIRMDGEYLMKDMPLTINLRGKFRRMKCKMPPLLLNFKKSTLKDLKLANIDEVKLVTHCMEGDEGQINLAEERMIYQIYQSLTPISYRTIWLSVEYCNLSNPGECIKSAGFLLEPDKVISSRLGIQEKKIFSIAEDSIHYESYGLTAAFNFLIGNRDWSLVASRNAKLFYDKEAGKYVVIPYDFDYSNVVAASYRRETRPKTMIHPLDRIYEGEYFKHKAGEMLKTFYAFEEPVLDAVLNANNTLDIEQRKKICKYFGYWFDMVKRKKAEDLTYGLICPFNGGL